MKSTFNKITSALLVFSLIGTFAYSLEKHKPVKKSKNSVESTGIVKEIKKQKNYVNSAHFPKKVIIELL